MSKDKISDYSSTANSNTDIAGINIDEGCAPSGINDAIRTLMAQLKTWQSGGQDVYITPAGSATVPAVTTTGDTNTGLFFPAADTVGITTGGTERARVDSSGNLGLGVTPSAWGSSFRALQVTNASALWSATSGDLQLANNAYYDGTNYKFIYGSGSAYAAQYQQKDGKHIWQTAGSGTAGGTITFTQAMTLDASGNFMVGGTSANGRARFVAAASTDCVMNLETSTNNYASAIVLNALNDNGAIYNYIRSTSPTTEHWKIGGAGASSTLVFYTGGTERGRFDSNGQFSLSPATAANPKMVLNASNNTVAISFRSAGVDRGNIYFLDSGVSYNTTSDYRLKENIEPMVGALAKVAALKPVTYKWKINGAHGQGFIAHELQEVVPDAVTGSKDAVDADGNPEYQGIDTSFLVATLTAAIQEQQAIIETLTARIEVLEQA